MASCNVLSLSVLGLVWLACATARISPRPESPEVTYWSPDANYEGTPSKFATNVAPPLAAKLEISTRK